MLCTKLLISLKTTLNRSGAPCCPIKGLTWTHCSIGCDTAVLGSAPELNIALKDVNLWQIKQWSHSHLRKRALVDVRGWVGRHDDVLSVM